MLPFGHGAQHFGYDMSGQAPVFLGIVQYLNPLNVQLLETTDGSKLCSPFCSMS